MPTQIFNLKGMKNVERTYVIKCDSGFLEKFVIWSSNSKSLIYLDSMKEYGYIRFLDQGKKNFPRFLVQKKIEPQAEENITEDVFWINPRQLLEIPINHQFGNDDKIKFGAKWTNPTYTIYYVIMLLWR